MGHVSLKVPVTLGRLCYLQCLLSKGKPHLNSLSFWDALTFQTKIHSFYIQEELNIIEHIPACVQYENVARAFLKGCDLICPVSYP